MQELEVVERPLAAKAGESPKEPESEPAISLPTQSAGRLWLWFAAVVVAVLFAAALRWSLAHPHGVHWDEAEYFNDVHIDVQRLQSGMVLRWGGRLLLKSWGRPPAFRMIADPILAVLGFHTFTARLISLVCFGFSIWFVYLTVRRLADQAAGALAALVFALSPEVVSAGIFFGTDTSLYLATSAMLYYLVAIWSERQTHSRNWIGLGLALGLGFLAKTSFIVIAVPVLAFWFVTARWGKWNLPSFLSQWKAGALAFVIAGPWWIVNAKAAFAYGHYARTFVRNSLGSPSIATGIRWLNTAIQCLLGHAIGVLIAILLAAFFVAAARCKTSFNPLQKAVLSACACAGLPIICAQLSGTNHLLRHISPAMIPLSIAVGLLFEQSGSLHSPAMHATLCALFCIQLGMLIAPVVSPNTEPVDLGFVNAALPWRTMVRFDQWDWSPAQDIADSCGVKNPKISYLGNGRAFSKPQIESAWLERAPARGAIVDVPDPDWLWRYENGPVDWPSLMVSADQSDIVLTAPQFAGEARYGEDQDNQYNAEFAARLSRDEQFRKPVSLKMGRFTPVEVMVFVKNNLTCLPAPGSSFPPVGSRPHD